MSEDTWKRGLDNGTDYDGMRPDTVGSEIAFHERDLNVAVGSLHVNTDEADAWRYFVPRAIAIQGRSDVPAGGALLVAGSGRVVAFLMNADLRPWEADWGTTDG
jgi:hypothetical protein